MNALQNRQAQSAGPRSVPSAPRFSAPRFLRTQPAVQQASHQRLVKCRSGAGVGPDSAEAAKNTQFDVDAQAAPSGDKIMGRDDDCLPESLVDAVMDSAKVTAEAVSRGNSRCMVELLLTEFWDPISGPIFPNKGDQERFWRMTRRFAEELGESSGIKKICVVYPDTGVAAMLEHKWPDAPFRISALTDRFPIEADDELVLIACPDPFTADDCLRTVRIVGQQDEAAGRNAMEERPVVLFNPRLSSGDVGLGLNARRLRESFLKNFVVTYSLKPIADVGSVFRRYPEQWKVFVEDPELPGRYKLISTRPSRPDSQMLDYLLTTAAGGGPGGEVGEGGQAQGGFMAQLGTTLRGVSSFMRSLSK